MKQNSALLIIILSILFSNCTNSQSENDEKSEVIEILNNWNKFHNEKDILNLLKLYNENVFYYGQNKSLNYITKDKSKLFKKFNSFKQENVRINELSRNLLNEEIKISFTKKVTIDSEEKDYPSYLILKKENDTWKISTESDLITNKNISEKSTSDDHKKISGDFNGDGKKEYAWIETPQRLVDSEYIIDESKLEEGEFHVLYGDFIGGAKSVIHFSNKTIWPITLDTANGELSNIGDLNDDGSDNICVYTSGGRSSALRVINANNYYKPNLIEPLFVNRNIYDSVQKEDMLEKISNKLIRVTYSTFSEKGEYELITKEIKLK
ncbi:hypothetical protein FPF71_06400 [Algibacter amylolyticus]|uniref:Nuclear transport factor 2 family protein n=1 Tax=Algibacter amylolyticus TaxID=1608400 RepID=A0A5M7BA73_9FLAO|nr:hypothetical protein [Algibacter amylolyticus]KAA5826443.1 hypothetical protein F2B50_06400 [Algibacter amylolyticus]MBB5268652.1 ketosteroid isomerase-like protein [Algibacter amylolyticus]TSJ80481.1 hypothetical protein FPF71_06400 [Algibacter amylolyticus]